jgi:glucokinase
MRSITRPVLLGDIGGTNARFALLDANGLHPIESIPVGGYRQFEDAVEAFFMRGPNHAAAASAILAVAGPVEDGRCELTNSSWVIDAVPLSKTFDWERVRVINDFEAIAWSLPCLTAPDLIAIGGGLAVPAAPAVVLGPGTGLGLACFVPRERGAIVLASEAGHVTLPGTCQREDAVIEKIRERFNHVSAERALSGEGLVNLYRAVGSIDGNPIPERGPAEITSAALDGSCSVCQEALDLFCAMLGTFAGNAALTFAARGGIYIAGGIAPRIVRRLTDSQFRSRFESKGRFGTYLAAIPTWIIVNPEPAFVGLQHLAHGAGEAGR